jgi:hypothetical protein
MPRMNITLNCKRCDAEYRPNYPPKGETPARYCSAACSTAVRFGERPDLRCATCNGMIEAKGRTRKYCSMACRNEGKRGRPSPRRKSWDDYPAPVRDPQSGCLRWQGPHHSNGYGRLRSTAYAHREAWEREVGPIPEGMTIDHVAERGCIHRDCVEIAHLEVVTQSVNTSRSARSIEQRSRTHCPQGHPYAGKNLIVRRGKRECRSCHHAGIERRRLAHKGEAQT